MKRKFHRSGLFWLIAAIGFGVLFLCTPPTASSGGFAKRKQITIHASEVTGSSPHIDFPVMIKLEGSEFQEIEDDTRADGNDIVFRASDGVTALAHEIEIYDEGADLLVAWVRIPSLSPTTDTDIYMYYGDSTMAFPTEFPPGVWNVAYGGVWHLGENPGAAGPDGIGDSTANGNHGTDYGSMNSSDQVDGMIGKALDFDGIDDYVLVPHDPSIDFGDEDFTISFWIKGLPLGVGDNDRLFVKGTSSGGCGLGKRYELYYNNGNLRFAIDDDAVKTELAFSPNVLLDFTWHRATLIRDAGNDLIQVYVDGSFLTQTGASTGNISNGCPLTIAARGPDEGGGRTPNTILDDFRISRTVRSPDWIKTSYDNQNSPLVFYSIGDQETNGADPTVPSLTITSPTGDPTYTANTADIVLDGSAGDDVGVVEVWWSNDTGGSGVASGTTNWSANIGLALGTNVITVTARDAVWNTGSDVLTVAYVPDDDQAPSIAITSPTSGSSFTTDLAAISLDGFATDNIGVMEVTWTNDTGGSGVCSGTTSWGTDIGLALGTNVITVTARDFSSNISSDVLTVEYVTESTPDPLPGCGTSTTTDYSGGFLEDDFDLYTVASVDGHLVLQTGQHVIDPENIIIPFEQEVWVSFLFEGAAEVHDFGWFLKDDWTGVGVENMPLAQKHGIFHRILDDDETGGCCGGGNGVFDVNYGFDSFPKDDEAGVAAYDDGTGYPFMVDWDGSVTGKDMKKRLGTFAPGTEIVFFLTGHGDDWNDPGLDTNKLFYTKKDFNPDVYATCTPGYSPFDKLYHLDYAAEETVCMVEGGWLSDPALTRLATDFGLNLSGIYTLPITEGEKFSHVIVGAPDNNQTQWILGFDDGTGGGDADHNDVVFRIERRTGGTAELKASEAIVPPDADSYYTAVTISVYDKIAGGSCSGRNNITYYVSIDAGANWVEVTGWDVIKTFSEVGGNKVLGADVSNWTPGTPEMTYRVRRIDFSGLDLTGRELIWKAEMVSEDDGCIPEIVDIVLDGDVANHLFLSRSSPIVLGNVLYSGNYETPESTWTEKQLRGHVTATRIWDPSYSDQTATQTLWDAGAVLSGRDPATRTIYFPDITVTHVTDEILGLVGDGVTTTFSGTLNHSPVVATTLTITDQHESFHDEQTDVLEGNFGGTGTVNRFIGAFEITFNDPPGIGVPIRATYTYYHAPQLLKEFKGSQITNAVLGLDDTFVIGGGYKYDIDGDGDFDEADGDWLVNWVRGYRDGVSTPKEWLLGPIDHSTPAVASPPGIPEWYYGTATTDAERDSFDIFRENWKERQTVLYIGSRGGMLHAFDAGYFRWGDNPDTAALEEKRGYFLWDGVGDPDYGTGEELWAFIPDNLLPRLKYNLLSGDDKAFVDASPAIADVFVGGQWRTVLLFAEGNGGDTVSCLDVTDPSNPDFLWEFADPELFRSRSSPSIAEIGKIQAAGTPKWAAFFVSGKTYDTTLNPSVYIIDVADGSIIQRIFLDDDGGSGIDSGGGVPSGQPAIVDSDGNGYIDRVYVGTDKGLMYKINLPDNPGSLSGAISHTVINTDFVDKDSNAVPAEQRYHPIYAAPSVVVDNDLKPDGTIDYGIKIFFGTGDSPYYDENINMAGTQYHFFAYVDKDGKGGDGSAVELDWFFTLPPGHRIFASAFAAAGNVYFGTSTSETEDPCYGTNEGRLYGFTEDGTLILEEQVGNIVTSPVVEDEHLYYRTRAGIESRGSGTYNNEGPVGGIAEVRVKSWRELQ